MTKAFLALACCLLASGAAAADAVGSCAGGCPARSTLTALALSPSRADRAFDKAAPDPEEEEQPDGKRSPAAPLAPAQPQAGPRQRQGPPPAASERNHGGGLGNFLVRHKWDIVGGIAGSVLSFILGGIVGLIAGIVLSVAVGYFGRKLERGA